MTGSGGNRELLKVSGVWRGAIPGQNQLADHELMGAATFEVGKPGDQAH